MSELTGAKQVSKVSFYQVTDGQDVVLDVVVGMGMPSGASVTLNGEPLAHAPQIAGLEIGEGSTLHGKTLVVVATVRDDNPNTDNTAATLYLRGGTVPKELPASAVADPNQLVVYTFLVNLL